jgi:hypothetical protein
MALKIKNSTRVHANYNEVYKELMAEKMDKITINIPKSLKKKFLSKTVKNDVKMTNVIIDSIKEYVGDNK